MPTRISSVRQRQVVYGSVAYVVFYIALLLHSRHDDTAGSGIVDMYLSIPPLIAGWWGMKLARTSVESCDQRRSRFGWLLVAIGCLTWGFGQVLWSYYPVFLRVDAPFPGPPDAFYLFGYLFAICGVGVLFSNIAVPSRARHLFDCAVAVSGAAVASWYFVIEQLCSQPGIGLTERIVDLCYPTLGLVAVFAALALATAPVRDKGLRWCACFLGAGILLISSANTTNSYFQYYQGALEAVLWTHLCWTVGWLVLGFGFALQLWFPSLFEQQAGSGTARHLDDASDEMSRSLLILLSPYVVATIICTALIADDFLRYDHPRTSTFAATYFVVAMIVIRQIFTLCENQKLVRAAEAKQEENQRLTGRLRSFSDGLEQVVEQRAQQLSALHQLTKAVHTTQQVDGVLSAAAKHTATAMRGVMVAVWLREPTAGPGAPPFCLSCYDGGGGASAKAGGEGELPTAHPVIERFVQLFTPRSADSSYIAPIREARKVDGTPGSHQAERALVGEMLCAPMRFRSEILGIIAVARTKAEPEEGEQQSTQSPIFDQSDHDLLESIGIEVATALHHARQFAAAVDAADHDPVTNLYNHRAIHQRFDEELAMAKAEDHPLSVMMMDLNDFKLFNDTYGHPVGDQVLRLVAKALREEIQDAICGRYGGDEFLVLIPRASAEQAREFAERLRQRLISEGFQNPLTEHGRTIPIAISFGVALYPEDSMNRQELLTLADSNLYKAKKSEDGIGITNSAQRANRRLKAESSFGILDAMVTSVDNKDKYTRQHSEDVTKYALWLAQELRLSDETMRIIRIGGLLHDVGKIGVPEDILRKPGHLTDEEYEIIKQHPTLGAMIVSAVPGMEAIVDAVRYHHERWDGRGYPDKLAGTDIPMLGRIMAVADAFSAMTTNRAYRAGMDFETALGEIHKNIGTQFDPLMARAFCNAVRWRLSIEISGGTSADVDLDPGLDELPLAA